MPNLQEHHSQDNKRKLIWEATGYKDMYFIHSFVAVPEDHEGIDSIELRRA